VFRECKLIDVLLEGDVDDDLSGGALALSIPNLKMLIGTPSLS
jgi:hypothetical protein